MGSERKRGRMARGPIDCCETAYWAWWVRHDLDMDFAKIERMLDPTCFVHQEDIGGYKQPHLWSKYGHGVISPVGNGRSKKNALLLAEKASPGSQSIFNSALWQLLRIKSPTEKNLRPLCQKLSADIRIELSRLAPNETETFDAICRPQKLLLDELAKRQHIDVLAVLLIQLAVEKNILEQVRLVAFARWWLNRAIVQGGATKSVAHLLLPILEDYQPLLGRLLPLISMKKALTPEEHHDKAFQYIYFDLLFLEP